MKKLFIFCFVTCFISVSVFGSNYEKTIRWSAKWSALGGAAAGAVNGSDALYYNPAGLVDGNLNEIGVNVSPFIAYLEGPITRNNELLEAEKSVVPLASVLGSYSINDSLSLGLGAYVAGGLVSEYKSVDFSAVSAEFDTLKPDFKSQVSDIEISLGSAYKLNKNFSFGAAWRMSIVRSNFEAASVQSLSGVPLALINVKLNDLETEDYKGFRFGAKYLSDSENWGLGVSYRTEVPFKLKGKSTGYIETTSLAGNLPKTALTGGGDVEIENTFPMELSFGGFYNLSEIIVLYGSYTWSNDSVNKKIVITGDPLIEPLASSNVLRDVVQDWKDQHLLRLGAEYLLEEWILRGGFAFTSQATPDDRAKATFPSPNPGYSFIIGTGKEFIKDKLILDFALGFDISNASDKKTEDGIEGDFKNSAVNAHASLKYRF